MTTALQLCARPPEDLETCEEGCYWRWLVHTLLEDVATLKKSLDEAQEELAQRSQTRRKLEQAVEHREQIKSECVILRASLETLRVDVPDLRDERERLVAEHAGLVEQQRQLEERKHQLGEEIEVRGKKEKEFEAAVREVERHAEHEKEGEQTLIKQIRSLRTEMDTVNLELTTLTSERDKLKSEVTVVDVASKGKPKKGNRRGSSKKK